MQEFKGRKQSESHSTAILRTENMIRQTHPGHQKLSKGFSAIELLVVLAVAGVLMAIALPAMISQRRLSRFSGVTREFVTQLRYARQLAMSQRQAITFQYDDATKEIKIIDHNNDPTIATSGTAVLADPTYPNTAAPAQVVVTVSLLQGGLPGEELAYGVPTTSSGLPSGHVTVPTSLGDGTTMTTLPGSNQINITFQADGSVVNPTGVPVGGLTLSQGARMDGAIFIFNNRAAASTVSAISVLGTSGRVKLWRYDDNANTFIE
jgi:prepilin-type N-terminal cleavage/methylation domain-containing protein